MYSDFYNEKNEYLSIITASLLFHLAIAVALLIAIWLRPAKENPPPIPFFEMVNLAPPAPSKPTPKPPEPVSEPEPVAEPEPIPTKPELKPEPKLEPKPVPVAKQEKPKHTPTPTAPAEPTKSHSMDMELPSDIKSKDMDMPTLTVLGDVIMDPLLQEYVSRVIRLIKQNFNPPAGTEISKDTKSTVVFQIARNGEISEISLNSSSGNRVWDRLAVRAVQITKAPPFPSSLTHEKLVFRFNAKEE